MSGLWRREKRRRDEAGYAAILVALVVSTLGIVSAAIAIDTAQWYVEVQKVQRAADAAALGGVPFMPQDFASAERRAKELAAVNGYAADLVDVEPGEEPTELRVSISSPVVNQFGSMLGIGRATITESATADYQGPAPMGSPCNTFGNEPNAGNGNASGIVTGSAQGSNVPANCSRRPQMWATIEGPQTGKVQGDRYQTLRCEDTGVDGCSGTTNSEYDPFGYVFLVKVQPGAVNTPVRLQLYDPMFVNTRISSSDCGLLPSSSEYSINSSNNRNRLINPWVRSVDAHNRYTRDGQTDRLYADDSFETYCTGDGYAGAGSGRNPREELWTTFLLREQTDTQNPKRAAVQRDTGGSKCVKQYGSYNTRANQYISSNVFREGSGSSYNAQIARTFHNWSDLCTFTPRRAGDYYLQVRSNVNPAGGGSGYIRDGNSTSEDAVGARSLGEGANSFAIRAVAPGKERQVSVSGYNHMPIYVNGDGSRAEFNLIRVLPGSAGAKISFSYFDAGDAQGAGYVQVLPPLGATGNFAGTCTSYGGSSTGSQTDPQDLSNCRAPFEKPYRSDTSKNNGKSQTINIPIPADYDCDTDDFTACWYRVEVSFGSGSVTDVTTWDATIDDDPVRLVK